MKRDSFLCFDNNEMGGINIRKKEIKEKNVSVGEISMLDMGC